MAQNCVRLRTAAALAVAAGLMPAARALANTYTWVGPYSGTSNPWSAASSWAGSQLPVSSATTQLIFTNSDLNYYASVNDLSSSFSLNNLTFQNWSQGGNIEIDSWNGSGGTCQLEMTGNSPVISVSGPSSVTAGSLASGTGYGLFLNPASGSTTISSTGNGLISIGADGSNGASLSGITGTGGFTINDTGLATVQLLSPSSGSTDNYTGGVNLISGSLSLPDSLSLGDASNILTFNGGNLRGGSAALANNITANSDAVVFSGSPTIQGVISGNGGLHLYNGVAYSAAKVTLTNAETYYGATTIDNGPLQTVSSNLGSLVISPTASLLNTSAVNVGQRGTLTFTAGPTNSAIPSSAPLSLNGASVNITANSSTTAETLGNVASGGLTTLTYTGVSGSATNTLNFGALIRTDQSTLFIQGNWAGNTNASSSVGVVNFSSGITTVADANAPAGYAPVVPFVFGNGSANTTSIANYASNYGFVTSVNGSLSLIPIFGSQVTQSNTSSGFAGLTNDVYLNITSAGASTVTLSANAQVYALATSTTSLGDLTIAGTGTLNIASGVMLVAGTTTLSGPTINFGTNTGYIFAGYTGTSLAIFDKNSPITGSNGLVISGPAGTAVAETVQFSDIASTGSTSDSDSSNPFTGGLTINGGVDVAYTNDLQLGAAGQGITLNGGELEYNNTKTNLNAILSRPIRLGSAGGSFFTFGGTTLSISSLISGPGAFYSSSGYVGTGTVALTNAGNTYAGGTYVYTGTLSVSADGDLGQAGTPLVLAGGVLQFGAATTLARPVPLWSVGSTIDTNGFSSSISGSFSSVSPTAAFTKIGSGTLSLTAAESIAERHTERPGGDAGFVGQWNFSNGSKCHCRLGSDIPVR